MRLVRLLFGASLCLCASLAAASDPGPQALSLYKAIHQQDWKALYRLAAFSPVIRKQLQGPDKFATDIKKGIDAGGNSAAVTELFKAMANIKVGKPIVKDNQALVPTSCDISIHGTTLHFHGKAKMVLDDGVWKWNLAYTDDVEKATSESLQKLIGEPDGK